MVNHQAKPAIPRRPPTSSMERAARSGKTAESSPGSKKQDTPSEGSNGKASRRAAQPEQSSGPTLRELAAKEREVIQRPQREKASLRRLTPSALARAGQLSAATRAQPRQYSVPTIIATWAAAALPMAALGWVVAPLLARSLTGPQPLVRSLIVTMTVGLVWQFVLVLILVHREQQTLRWSVVKDVLWLHSPTSPRSGRRGGRVWLIVLPLIVLFGIEEKLPTPPPVATHRLNTFLESQDGQSFLSGNWTWLTIVAALVLFNTVLGEELLFRGLLLPRMNKVFGRWDGLANGVLFAAYHLHMPWAIPWTLLDAFLLSYPSTWTRSALVGIVVHSAQSVVILAVTTILVLS